MKPLIDRGKDQKSSECLSNDSSLLSLKSIRLFDPSSSINSNQRNFTFHQFFLTPFPDFLTPFEPYLSLDKSLSSSIFVKIFVRSLDSMRMVISQRRGGGGNAEEAAFWEEDVCGEKSAGISGVLGTNDATADICTCHVQLPRRRERARALIMHRWLPVDGHKWADDRPR